MKKEQLFETMVKAIETKNQKELEYLIAKKEADEAIEAYKKQDTQQVKMNINGGAANERY